MPNNIDLLRRLVRQQVVKIGGRVNNMFGAVAGQSPAILLEQEQKFLVAQVAGVRLLSPEDFYAAYLASQTRNYQVIQATEGVFVATSIATDSTIPSTFLIRTITNNPGPINVPITIKTDSPISEFAVYVEGVLQRRGSGELSINLSLDSGKQLIEIVAVAKVFGLSVPPNIRFSYDVDTVPTPIWSTIRTGYLDASLNALALELEWYNDTRVGGWIVFRRIVTYLNEILGIGLADGNGEFTIEIAGNVEQQVITGGDILAGNEFMGTVITAYFEEETSTTIIRCHIDPARDSTDPDWVGRLVAVGQFVEQTRVRRTTKGGSVSWKDLSVLGGTLYEYVLQAFGLFNELQLSAFSEVRRVVPGDVAPPSSIVFDTGYPIVDRDKVTAKFLTPSEQDYDGVQIIYYDKPSNGFGTSTGGNNSQTLICNNKSWTLNEFSGFVLAITGGTGAGQLANIVGNSITELQISSETAWVVTPDTTSSFEIYRLVNVATDYGLPSTKDEVQFSSIGLGRYYFCTFDRALNIQSIYAAAYWDFDGEEDLVSPITTALIFDRTADGKQSQTQFGMSLYSVPPATEVLLETFEDADDQPFLFYDSGIFALTGNTTVIFNDPSKSWTTDQHKNKVVRIYSVGSNFNRILRIASNTATTILVTSDAPLPPNGMQYQILGHAPARTPTATEYWQMPNPDRAAIRDNKLVFDGDSGDNFEMFIDSSKNTDLRYEAVITRGIGDGHGDYGNNLTYRADSGDTHRFEYGVLHEDASSATIRYRYNSGGTGDWVNLTTQYPWSVGTARRLIVELDNDIQTFRIAAAEGHDERVLGRAQISGIPDTFTFIGWSVNGDPDGELAGDALDEVRILDFDTLVRIKYKLLPYEDPDTQRGQFLEIPLWSGTVSSGNSELLVDPTKLWTKNELITAFVRITSGDAEGSDSRILANDAQTLTPSQAFSAATGAGTGYMVYEKYYTGTERLRWWAKRLPKQPQYLLFHGERLGAPIEPENRILVDSNSVPEIFLTLRQVEPFGTLDGVLEATVERDDDVATYRLLLRKSNWPSQIAVSTAEIPDTSILPDLKYTKYFGNMDFDSQSFQVDVGTWYGAAIPYDTNGSPGPVSWAKVIVIGETPPPVTDNPVLVITQQPAAEASDGVDLNPAPIIQLQDSLGRALFQSGVTVTVSGSFGGTPSGATSVQTDAFGVADFTGLAIDNTVSTDPPPLGPPPSLFNNYITLTFSASGYASISSNSILLDRLSLGKSLSIDAPTEVVTGVASGSSLVQLRTALGAIDPVADVVVTASPSVGYTMSPTSAVTNSNGLADFADLTISGPTGDCTISYSASGYLGRPGQPIAVIPSILYSLSNVSASTRLIYTDITTYNSGYQYINPLSGSYNGVLLYWEFPTQFNAPNSAGTLDIYVWGSNSNYTKIIAQNLPVYNKLYTQLPATPYIGASGFYITNSGNVAVPSKYASVNGSLGGTRQTINYKLIFKVNGVVHHIVQKSFQYVGSSGLG